MTDALTKQALIFLFSNALEFSGHIINCLTIIPSTLSYFSFTSGTHSLGFLSSTLDAHFPLPVVPFVQIGLGSSLISNEMVLRPFFGQTSPNNSITIKVLGIPQMFIPILMSVLSSNKYIQHSTQCLHIGSHGYFRNQCAQTPNHLIHNKAVPFVVLHVSRCHFQ